MTSPARHALSEPAARALEQVHQVLDGAVTWLIVPTSGSTGEARRVALSGAALRASGTAAYERLGGVGQWLLALPVDHVAGLQVLVRGELAAAAGMSATIEMPTASGFRPAAFVTATAALDGDRRYTSLVPTQLRRVLADPAGRAALATYDAVLVGGARTDPALLAAAAAAGARVVTTYGMSETSGGCVYDGVPFSGVEVHIGSEQRIFLRGPVLTDGYLTPAGTLDTRATSENLDEDGWWRTNDAGIWADGRLTVLGRLDDVIVTGGVNVVPGPIESIVTAWSVEHGGGEACVIGVGDDEWGERVVAVVQSLDAATDEALTSVSTVGELRERVTERLGAAAAPHRVVPVRALPARGPGKIDRREISRIAAAATGR